MVFCHVKNTGNNTVKYDLNICHNIHHKSLLKVFISFKMSLGSLTKYFFFCENRNVSNLKLFEARTEKIRTNRLRDFGPHICKQKVNNGIDIFAAVENT